MFDGGRAGIWEELLKGLWPTKGKKHPELRMADLRALDGYVSVAPQMMHKSEAWCENEPYSFFACLLFTPVRTATNGIYKLYI